MNGPGSIRLLLIDNYDSFTYNLVQAFLILGAEVDVRRNDEITVEQAKARIMSMLTPASYGVPGPGDMHRCVGASASACSTVISSLRRTSTSAPRIMKACTRL